MQVAAIEKKQRALHPCPRCGLIRVKRLGTGIWQCRRCEVIFAGGAYMPKAAKVIKAAEEMSAAPAAKAKMPSPGFMKDKKGKAEAAIAAAEPTKKVKKAIADKEEKAEAARAEKPKKARVKEEK